jgi:tetratricopeptide (TPR) repeat protein
MAMRVILQDITNKTRMIKILMNGIFLNILTILTIIRLKMKKRAILLVVLLLIILLPSHLWGAVDVARVNMMKLLLNNAENYLEERQILLALETIVQAEKLNVPSDRYNSLLAKILATRKEKADNLFQKAELQLTAGKINKAIFYLKQIIDFWPDNERARNKLEKLGVKLKTLTIKAEQYQEAEISILQKLNMEIKNVQAALKELQKLEKERNYKEALLRAEQFYSKFNKHPAVGIKLTLYQNIMRMATTYEKIKAMSIANQDEQAIKLIDVVLQDDAAMGYGLRYYTREEYAIRLYLAGRVSQRLKNKEAYDTLLTMLDELGSVGLITYLTALDSVARNDYPQALRELKNARLLTGEREQHFMELSSLTLKIFILNYKFLLLALFIQIIVFSTISIKTFFLADLVTNHELTRILTFSERETGYYYSRCSLEITRGKWKKAEKLAKYLINRNPNLSQAHLWKGICRFHLGDKKMARLIIQKFLKEHPRNQEANFYMALIEDANNRPKEAIFHLELAKGISGASRTFDESDIRFKGDKYFAVFKEYKESAQRILGIKIKK